MMMRMQIGPLGARFKHLISVEEKILAEYRQRRRLARLHQVLGRAWNEGPSVSTERQDAPPA